jgi:hypothetical protein
MHLRTMLVNRHALKRINFSQTMSKLSHNLLSQEKAVDSRLALLEYLLSNPKQMTIESYICLTDVLIKAGWRYVDGIWHMNEYRLSIMEAARVEINREIATIKAHVLQQTVKNNDV